MRGREDLRGREFSRLTVVRVSHRTRDRVWHWHCTCECGARRVVSGKNLRNGNTKSCGCVHGVPIDNPVKHEQLLRLLSYDQYTGHFRWLLDGRAFKAGELAGYCNHHNPYVRISIGAVSYLAHILAWFYMTGRWPEDEIDHENRDKGCNVWTNLREATRLQNCGNQKTNARNSTGYKGVSFRRGRYRVTVAGVDVGTFSDVVAAARRYDAEARKRYGKFASTNFGMRP